MCICFDSEAISYARIASNTNAFTKQAVAFGTSQVKVQLGKLGTAL